MSFCIYFAWRRQQFLSTKPIVKASRRITCNDLPYLTYWRHIQWIITWCVKMVNIDWYRYILDFKKCSLYFYQSLSTFCCGINPLLYNVPRWSDTLERSRTKCCKIFKVCLTILRCYALKGWGCFAVWYASYADDPQNIAHKFPLTKYWSL